ncbi:MAG: hypothetical protein K9G57_01390 [Ignavibacteriales bacterium]|nr:hypothetical protein [Ignavibacteriales bacterium]
MKSSKKYLLARGLSDLFVPPVNTFLLFLFLSFLIQLDHNDRLLLILSGFFLGFLLPLMYFILLRRKGIVSDRDATIKEERTMPYTAGILISIFGGIVTYLLGFSGLVLSIWVIYFFNSLFILLINRFWKISAHALGLSSPITVLAYLNSSFIIPGILIFTIVGWSRLELKKHTFSQILAGGALGNIVSFIILKILE